MAHIDSPELEALKGIARARNAIINTPSTVARVRNRHEAILTDIDG